MAAACTKSATDIKKLLAESELFIELCMGLANGIYGSDLSSKNATQPPAAGKLIRIMISTRWVSDVLNSGFSGKRIFMDVLTFPDSWIGYLGRGMIALSGKKSSNIRTA